MNQKVLFVDDEDNILKAYKRALRKEVDMDLASGGEEALALLSSSGPYAVIVSDMRMPGMDGVELLSRVKEKSPNTVRIMLTGNSDQQTAIDAVNKGDIFRFLNKPCPAEELAATLRSGFKQYRLVMAEKELLHKTLSGSIKALVEVLSLANPEAFGRVTQMRKRMLGIMQQLGMPITWWMEPLVMLSQIGCVILPGKVVRKIAVGDLLSGEEEQLFNQHPLVGADLLAKIPRMGHIAEGIRYQEKHYDGGGIPHDNKKGDEVPFGGRLLKVLIDFDRGKIAGLDDVRALNRLRRHKNRYDPTILAALERMIVGEVPEKPREVAVGDLTDGMVLARNITTRDGILIVNAGQEVTPTMRRIISNFYCYKNIATPIMVLNGKEPVSEREHT